MNIVLYDNLSYPDKRLTSDEDVATPRRDFRTVTDMPKIN